VCLQGDVNVRVETGSRLAGSRGSLTEIVTPHSLALIVKAMVDKKVASDGGLHNAVAVLKTDPLTHGVADAGV
jgi:hypothetical protein